MTTYHQAHCDARVAALVLVSIQREYADGRFEADALEIARVVNEDHCGPRARMLVDRFVAAHDPLHDHVQVAAMKLWRALDDLCDLEAHMFCQLLYVLNAVIGDGSPIPPLPHAHVHHTSRDCDGPHEYDSIVPLRLPSDPDGEFGTRDLVRTMLPITSFELRVDDDLQADVSYGFEDYGRNLIHVSWSLPTDEGFESTTVVGCLDRCDLNETSQRDVFAEAAGY